MPSSLTHNPTGFGNNCHFTCPTSFSHEAIWLAQGGNHVINSCLLLFGFLQCPVIVLPNPGSVLGMNPTLPYSRHLPDSRTHFLSNHICIYGAALCLWCSLPSFQVKLLKWIGTNRYRDLLPCIPPCCDAPPVYVDLKLFSPPPTAWPLSELRCLDQLLPLQSHFLNSHVS